MPALRRPRKSPEREAEVEAYLGDVVKHLGGTPYKFTSPARRSVPDRLCLLPIPPEHQAIVGRYVRFVETKRPGQKATPAQQREHDRLRALGYRVLVLADYEEIDHEFITTNPIFAA